MLQWVGVAASFATWVATYKYLDHFKFKLNAEYKSRVITLIYAIVILTCSAGTVYFERNGILMPSQPNPPLATLVCILSLSYFLFDFCWALRNGTEGPIMLVHHLLCILIFSAALVKETCASEASTILILAELSNPYLQFRYFVRQSDWKRTWPSMFINILFVCMYFVCRMVLMPQALWLYVTNPESDLLISAVGYAIYFISWIWWVMILRSIYRRFSKPQKSSK